MSGRFDLSRTCGGSRAGDPGRVVGIGHEARGGPGRCRNAVYKVDRPMSRPISLSQRSLRNVSSPPAKAFSFHCQPSFHTPKPTAPSSNPFSHDLLVNRKPMSPFSFPSRFHLVGRDTRYGSIAIEEVRGSVIEVGRLAWKDGFDGPAAGGGDALLIVRYSSPHVIRRTSSSYHHECHYRGH